MAIFDALAFAMTFFKDGSHRRECMTAMAPAHTRLTDGIDEILSN